MGNPRGMKRDGRAMRTLQERRHAAARLLRKGRTQAEVARHLGVSEMSVSRWARVLEHEGVRGLRAAGRTGRRPRLGESQREQLKRVLLEGPQAHGFANGLWTLTRVAAVIQQTCSIRYHPGHVSRVLRDLGWSCQRPVGKAMERDEDAIRHWKRYTWPALKKKPSTSAAPSSS
ncbi:MAG: IS630 family transposase [Lentisphaerae bacterium]|nr:IS630 family transposase [Lentisphaerota bacterium]